MTSQEILEFVSKPTPRKVPRNVFCVATDKNDRSRYMWFLIFSFLFFFYNKTKHTNYLHI